MTEPRCLLLTRPKPQSRAFAAELETALPGRFAPLVSPLLEIVPVVAPLDLAGAQGLIFTSANGVTQFAAREGLRDLPAYCVGEMTAEAARQAGFEARTAGGDVAALAALVRDAHRPGAGAFVHVRGRHAAGDLLGELARTGIPARAAALYDQRPRALDAEAQGRLEAGGVAAIAVFSPRTGTLLAASEGRARWDLTRTVSVALSAAADAPLAAIPPHRRIVCEAPTRAAMIAALGRL